MIDALFLSIVDGYKKNKNIFNNILFYLFATFVIFSNDIFHYLPKYRTLLSIFLTLIFASIKIFFLNRSKILKTKEPIEKSQLIKDNNISLLVKMVVFSIFIVIIIIFNKNDPFMDRGEKLIIDYYRFLDQEILMKDNVTQEANLKMFNFFHQTNKDPYPRRFPYHDIENDFFELWGTTVKHEILNIKKIKQNHYVAVIEVYEYIMEFDLPRGNHLTDQQKVDIVVDGLKRYFIFKSRANALRDMNEQELEMLIRDYLMGDDESFLFKMKLGDRLLWSIGSRFKLKLKEYDIQNTCHENLCSYISVRNFTTNVSKGTLTFWSPDMLKPVPIKDK